MITIHLDKLQFFSFHGIHEEERILGNSFEMDIAVNVDAPHTITTLEQTVNYAALYEMAKERMQQPTPLLETVAQELAEQIHASDQRIKSIAIKIRKKYPPIHSMEGSVAISLKKEY
jgi:dihydroneopterin aldolase